ncbi:CBS domain-containing protein [Arhodomonas sp. SL1]|uniref:CBS domain-containing protein n=1 Tax=Arhodomonas sp. SL1 TaxID=3425691 RepID=UPI003F881C8E
MRRPVETILRGRPAQLHALGPQASVGEAVRLMNQHNIGAVLVLDGDQQLLGIFTERDVLRRVIEQRLDYDATPVEEVMTRKVFVIPPQTPIEDALALVDKHNCRHLPVMDGDRLHGMISIRDLTAAVVADRESEIRELTSYIAGSY